MRITRAAILSCCLLGSAFAGEGFDSTYQLQPVDQAVADLDPLAVSLRRIDTGLRTDGERTQLFTPVAPPGKPQPARWMSLEPIRPAEGVPYYYISQGMRARVDRINYLVRNERPHGYDVNVKPRKDGEFWELIPANTVFELEPLFPTPPLDTQKMPDVSSQAIDRRLSFRLDTRVERQISNQIETKPLDPNRVDTRIEPRKVN